MRVPAVITNDVLAFVRDVLRDFGQKIKCAENLEVVPRSIFQITAGRPRESAAAILLVIIGAVMVLEYLSGIIRAKVQ